MKKIILLAFIFCSKVILSQDPNWQTQIDRYALSGVAGGIPNITNIHSTLSPGDNIQNAIDAAYNAGGGVVLLLNGTYPITATRATSEGNTTVAKVNLRSNVVLRGESRTGVILESEFRATENDQKFYSGQVRIGFYQGETVTNAGVENLTYFFKVDGNSPADDISGATETFYEVHKNGGLNGATDLHVTSFSMWGSNCWLKDVDVLDSGSSPLLVWGNHNTIINDNFKRSYCKSGGGNGYVWLIGNDNLLISNVLERLRHLTIAHYGDFLPAYNVMYGNILFRVEMNFHTEDGGFNLVENNIISPELIHHIGGQPYNTGVLSSGHTVPSTTNIIFNNDVSESGDPDLGNIANVIYRTTGEFDDHSTGNHIAVDSTPLPIQGFFYGATLTPPTTPSIGTGNQFYNYYLNLE